MRLITGLLDSCPPPSDAPTEDAEADLDPEEPLLVQGVGVPTVVIVSLLGIGLLVSMCVVASDVVSLDFAASVSATNTINAAKALNSVASAADKAAESDESPLASVLLVEFCVFEWYDVKCQH